MKKLIAISVMFALVVAGVFAADVSGEVIGTFKVANQDGDGDTMAADGTMNRMRIEASGENDDGTFGAWIRLQEEDYNARAVALAWWKPIPQFKLTLGGNPDGHWGLEGYSGWMFYQRATDMGVTFEGESLWGYSLGGGAPTGSGFGIATSFRQAFYEGFGGGLMLDIAPMDMLGINIGVPFSGIELADAYQKAVIQVNLNLDFGNIGLTFDMGASNGDGKVFVYFGLGAVENLSLDIGFGYGLGDGAYDVAHIGVALKYGFSDSFALKFRALASLFDDDIGILVDVMPVIGINENMTACISVGAANRGDVTNFHFNPFLWIGQEWGPSFWAGIKVWTVDNGDSINWSIPIGIGVGF
jgi:opacity protein-like surface antigen